MITALLYREIIHLASSFIPLWLKSFSRSHFLLLRNISKLRHMVSAAELEKIILAFVSSCLDYCDVLLTCPDKSFLARFWAILKAAAILVANLHHSYFISFTSAPWRFIIKFLYLHMTHWTAQGCPLHKLLLALFDHRLSAVCGTKTVDPVTAQISWLCPSKQI